MKKLLLTLFCLFAMFAVKAQCDYTLTMSDSYGDGWQGQNKVSNNFFIVIWF